MQFQVECEHYLVQDHLIVLVLEVPVVPALAFDDPLLVVFRVPRREADSLFGSFFRMGVEVYSGDLLDALFPCFPA